MVFITHDLELAAAICDRTAVMYAGQIVEIRESAQLHDDPLHPYTAALAAARPDIARTAGRLRAIPGRPLSAFEAPPDECAFAPRCGYAVDACRDGPARDHRAGRRAVPVRPRARAAREAGGAGQCLNRAATPVLEVTSLRKEFGDLVAVDDVSFRVAEAGSVAIVGESGSGKTTIARMIVGLERPTGGSITACGHDRSRPARSAAGPAAPGPRGADRVPGPVHQPGPAPDRRGGHRRDAPAAPRLARGPPPGAGRRAHRAGRPGRAAVPGAAAGAVRRAAAAGGDRPRPGRRAADPDPGRVRRGAGRVDPGPGAEPAGRHPRRDRRVLHPDQPRPGGRPPAHRGGGRALPRPGGRARPDAPGAGRPAGGLHQAAAGQRPAARLEAGPPRAARPETPGRRARERSALPVGERGAAPVPHPRAVAGRAAHGGDSPRRGGRAGHQRVRRDPLRGGAGAGPLGAGAVRGHGTAAAAAGRPAGRGQGRGPDRGPEEHAGLAAAARGGRRSHGRLRPAHHRRRRHRARAVHHARSSPARRSPGPSCGGSPATRGTPRTRRAAPAAGPPRRWRPGPRPWPPGPTSAGRSGSRRPSAA